MATIAVLDIAFRARTNRFRKGVRGAQRTMTGFVGTVRRSSRMLLAFGGALAGVLGGVGVTLLLRKSLRAYAEAELAQSKLAAVLKSTGHAAGLSAKQLNVHSTALMEMTTIDDEAITGVQTLLATFKQIRGNEFKAATSAIMDMSEVMGQDLRSSAIQVGKALNDPILGLTALRRVGVQLTDTQQKQVKQFMKLGDVVGAQKVILSELSSQFGGTAAAAADTFSGRMKQMGNRMGELQETIGSGLAPALKLLAEKMLASDMWESIGHNVVEFGKVAAGVVSQLGPIWSLWMNDILLGWVIVENKIKHFFTNVIPALSTSGIETAVQGFNKITLKAAGLFGSEFAQFMDEQMDWTPDLTIPEYVPSGEEKALTRLGVHYAEIIKKGLAEFDLDFAQGEFKMAMPPDNVAALNNFAQAMLPGALRVGSREAYSYTVQNRYRSMEATMQKQLAVQKQKKAHLEQIEKNTADWVTEMAVATF